MVARLVGGCLVAFVLISIVGCSNEATQSKPASQLESSSKSPETSVEPKEEIQLKAIGDFTNVKTDGEHQWGYDVSLWRHDHEVYGLISGSNGVRLIGDPPTGVLEDVKFDPESGKISFKSRLSTGKNINDKWTKNLYEFDGVLGKKKLEGKLTSTDQDCPDLCPEETAVTLKLFDDQTSIMEDLTLEEWESTVSDILKRLGPKW